MRQDKRWTIIKLPPEKIPDIQHFNCKIHRVRMVPVGEEGTLRCRLCGSDIVEEEIEDIFRPSGTI